MTDAEFEYELIEALNMLLEDERASVEMEVALAAGATEYGEREALAAMGAEDIHFCEQLRVEMEQAGLPVTPQINGVVFQVIGADRYDDRLRAFAHHQRVVAEHARELQESNLEGVLRDSLEGISLSHDRHAEWTERRAVQFAATRTMEFGAKARTGGAEMENLSAAEVAALGEDLAAQAAAAEIGEIGEEAPKATYSEAPRSQAQERETAEREGVRYDASEGPEDVIEPEVALAPGEASAPQQEGGEAQAPTAAKAPARRRATATPRKPTTRATTRAKTTPRATAAAPRRTRRTPSSDTSADA